MDLKVPEESKRRRTTAAEAEAEAREMVNVVRMQFITKLCPCGRTFVPYRSFQVYCCDAHRVKYSVGKSTTYVKKPVVTRRCKNCGADFETSDDKRRYCSPECYSEFQAKRRKPEEMRHCLRCGQEFITSHWLKRYCDECKR